MLVIHKCKQVKHGGLTIPLSSSIALLLVCVVSITSMLCIYPCCLLSNSVHAEEGDGSSERNTEKNDIDALIHTDNTVNTSVTNNVSRATSPSASLTINNGSNVNSSAITTAGDVAYISNDIRVQASDIESYAVQISYASGSNSLSLADGSVVLSGANNTTPTNMSPNTWGYSWSSTNTNPESTTYQTLSTTNTQLSGDSVSNNSIDFTRRLTFAAKFGEGVKAGHYSTSVLLSLTATPKVAAAYNYSVTYEMGDGHTIRDGYSLPEKQSITSASESQTFITEKAPMISLNPSMHCAVKNWLGSDSQIYAPGSTITLTKNNPNIILKTNETGTCIGGSFGF